MRATRTERPATGRPAMVSAGLRVDATVFEIGSFVLETQARRLCEGERVVELQPKAFDLLCHLVRHRDRVVSKEELFEVLWPDVFVSEWSITSCLRRVRGALGGSASTWIRTYRGRGFRFVGECRERATVAREDPPVGLERRGADAGRVFGRQVHIDLLRQALHDSIRGSGRTLLLRGAAGMGKSTLLRVLADLARGEAAICIGSAVGEGQGAPTAWIWTQVVRRLRDSLGESWLQDVPEGTAECLTPIVPELGAAAPAGGEPEGPFDRFRAYGAVCSLLRSAATSTPVVVLIEDLHGADEVSIALLRYAARELRRSRILLAATLRDDEAAQRERVDVELARLRSEAGVHEITVGPLDAEATGQVLAVRLPVPGEREVAEKIHAVTGGNPLLIELVAEPLFDVIRGAADSGAAVDAVLVEIPDAAGAILEQSLDRLDADAREVLRLASVLGVEFDRGDIAELLAASAALDPRDARRRVTRALQAGVAARVVRRAEEGRRGCAFVHGLIRGALYRELTPENRARLHRFAGSLVEGHLKVGLANASEVADHLLRGGDAAPARKTIEYCLAAAEQSGSVADFDRRVVFLEHAERLVVESHRSSRVQHAEILIALAQALVGAGRIGRAREVGERAVAVARETRRRELFVRAVVCTGTGIQMTGALDSARIALLEEALERLSRDDVSQRIEILRQLAWERFYDPRGSGPRLELSERAVALASEHGTDEELRRALEVQFHALQAPDLVGRQIANTDERIALGSQANVGRGYGHALHDKAQALLTLGELARAESVVDEIRRIVALRNDPADRLFGLLWEGKRASVRGAWDEFDAAIAEAERLARFVDEEMAVLIRMANTLGQRLVRGRIGVEEAEAAHAMFPQRPESLLLLVHALIRDDECERACRLLDEGLPEGVRRLSLDARFLANASQLGVAQARLGLLDDCAATYARLLPFEGRHLIFGLRGGAIHLGTVGCALGVMAGALQQEQCAEAHLTATAADCRRLEARPALASVLAAHARVLHERGRRQDRDRLAALIDEARAVADEAGIEERIGNLKTIR